MYTGSITASAVPIGPYFNMIANLSPTLSPILVKPGGSVLPNLYVDWGFLTDVPNEPTQRYAVDIVCSVSTLPWTIYIEYDDGFGWVLPFTALTGGTTIFSGTGTTTVYLQFAPGSYSTGNIIPRYSQINVENGLDPDNVESYNVSQNVRSGNSNNGWNVNQIIAP